MGPVAKRGIKERRYGTDWSVEALDVFFLEDDLGLSAFLPGSDSFEVLLLGRDPLA